MPPSSARSWAIRFRSLSELVTSFSLCREPLKFSDAYVLLLALAVYREQVNLIPHDDVVYDAITLARPASYRRVADIRFVHGSADARHNISRALAAFQTPGKPFSLNLLRYGISFGELQAGLQISAAS